MAYDRYAGLGNLALLNDAGNAWSQPINPGNNSSLSNSQCTLYGATSSVVPVSSTSVQVNLDLSFNGAFAGGKQAWLYTYDRTLAAFGVGKHRHLDRGRSNECIQDLRRSRGLRYYMHPAGGYTHDFSANCCWSLEPYRHRRQR